MEPEKNINSTETSEVERRSFGSPLNAELLNKMKIQAAIDSKKIYEVMEEAMELYLETKAREKQTEISS